MHDAGASIADMQTAHMPRFVVRLDRNCTARRNQLPANHGGRGRPLEYGALVRPLARTYKGHTLPATAADVTTQFTYEGRTIGVLGWRFVVRSEQKVAADNARFTISVYDDPLYRAPFVLGTNVAASPTMDSGVFRISYGSILSGRPQSFAACSRRMRSCPEGAPHPSTAWREQRRHSAQDAPLRLSQKNS